MQPLWIQGMTPNPHHTNHVDSHRQVISPRQQRANILKYLLRRMLDMHHPPSLVVDSWLSLAQPLTRPLWLLCVVQAVPATPQAAGIQASHASHDVIWRR